MCTVSSFAKANILHFSSKSKCDLSRFNICPSASPCQLRAEALCLYTWGLCILRPGFLRSLFHDSHPQGGRAPCRKSPCGSIETASKRKRNRNNPHRNRNNPPYHRPKIPIRSGRGAVAPRFFLPLPVTFSDNTAKVAASPLRITYIYL